MTSRVIPVAPFVLTVFGATGDLACRKQLPALFRRDFDGQLPEAATILGAARRPMSRDEFVALARDAIVEHIPASQTSGPELDRFPARLLFVAVDADGASITWRSRATADVLITARPRSPSSTVRPPLLDEGGPVAERFLATVPCRYAPIVPQLFWGTSRGS
jgi:glucose-6-phosphate 1-dehydrogenase